MRLVTALHRHRRLQLRLLYQLLRQYWLLRGVLIASTSVHCHSMAGLLVAKPDWVLPLTSSTPVCMPVILNLLAACQQALLQFQMAMEQMIVRVMEHMWQEQLLDLPLAWHHKQPSFPYEYSTAQAQVRLPESLQESTG